MNKTRARHQNIIYGKKDINLIADFYTTKGVYNQNINMNLISFDKFKLFLSQNLPTSLYDDYFKNVVKMDDIKNGIITSVFRFLKTPPYENDWDETIFIYIKNLLAGLVIILQKLDDVLVTNKIFINILDETNLFDPKIISYINLKNSMKNAVNYITIIVTHIPSIDIIINEPDTKAKNILMKKLQTEITFVNLLDKSIVKSLNKDIKNLNKIVKNISNLKPFLKVFKKYMIIGKMFDIMHIDIDHDVDFNIALNNNTILEKYIDEKYLIDKNMLQYIQFIFQFLNENSEHFHQTSVKLFSINFFKFINELVKINKSDNRIKIFEEITKDFGTDITDINIKTFLTEFPLNFKKLHNDKNILDFIKEMDNFYNYINNNPFNMSSLKTKITNFVEFSKFEFRNIFNHLDDSNDLLKGIMPDYFKKPNDNNYYKYFFTKNTKYEDIIMEIYKDIDDRILIIDSSKLDEEIIISARFEFESWYGTLKEFFDSFIELFNSEPNTEINKQNVIVRYMLMTDKEIKKDNDIILTNKILSELLDKTIFEKKFKIIKNLLGNLENEIQTKNNIKKAMANYSSKINLPINF